MDFLQKDVRKMPEHTEQQTVTYICPGCGSYLRFDGKAQGWACDYCGNTYNAQELEQRGAATKTDSYNVCLRADAPEDETDLQFHFTENLANSTADTALQYPLYEFSVRS